MEDKTNAIRIKNFVYLVEKHFEGSINAFAKANDISPTPYYMILSGSRSFGAKVAKNIELIFKLQSGQLDVENCISTPRTVAQLPVYSNLLSAANGNTIFDEKIIRYHAVDRNDITNLGVKEENLCIFEIHGDSMIPELYEGQKIIVDTTQTDIIENRLYAISINNNIHIKKLFKELNSNNLIAHSENTAYPISYLNDNKELKIIGRVVYLLGKIL